MYDSPDDRLRWCHHQIAIEMLSGSPSGSNVPAAEKFIVSGRGPTRARLMYS